MNVLPSSITHLTFGGDFNQSVDNLPNSITHLTFGYSFNQSVDKVVRSPTGSLVHQSVLPHSITHLTFGNNFNQSVDKLPNNITHLTFGHGFNQPIEIFPSNLKMITIFKSYKFINRLVGELPPSVLLNLVSDKCRYILTKGLKKGMECGRTSKRGDYCPPHYKRINMLK